MSDGEVQYGFTQTSYLCVGCRQIFPREAVVRLNHVGKRPGIAWQGAEYRCQPCHRAYWDQRLGRVG